jgi:hypothetical protein
VSFDAPERLIPATAGLGWSQALKTGSRLEAVDSWPLGKFTNLELDAAADQHKHCQGLVRACLQMIDIDVFAIAIRLLWPVPDQQVPMPFSWHHIL